VTGTRGRVSGCGLGSPGVSGLSHQHWHPRAISAPRTSLISHEEAKKTYQSHFIASVLNIYLKSGGDGGREGEEEEEKSFDENER